MYKKYFISFVAVALSVLIVIGTTVFVVDPFNHYRADPDMTKIVYQMPYYQNIGIAKYTEYDTLITGTSMTQNFIARKFDDTFGCKAIRLSFDGGLMSDFIMLLETATKNNEDLKQVYFGLDNYLITDDSELNQIEERIPGYLADDNIFNDVEYLFNKDVIFKYMRVHFAYKYSDGYDFYSMHAWDNGSIEASEEKVLSNYSMPKSGEILSDDHFFESADYVIKSLTNVIEKNPDIEFVFFAPPYSILYWHTQKVEGKLDATISAMERCYSELLKYENVRLFYFQSEFDMITDLNQYKDYTHYMMPYNDYMIQCFKTGKNEVSKEDITVSLSNMKNFAKSYTYDELLK